MAQKGSTHGSNIRVGKMTGIPATIDIGAVSLNQRADVSAVPLSGTRVFTLPSSSEILEFVVYKSTAAGEQTVRFGAAGSDGSNLYGQVSVSAVGVYRITNPSTVGSVWMIGGSSQPIGISVVSASGAITGLAGNVTVNVGYFRKYEKFDT